MRGRSAAEPRKPRALPAAGHVDNRRWRVKSQRAMPSPDVIKARLIAAFPDARVEVTDLTGTRDHFQAVVVTTAFGGRSRVEQHKMVYAALGELMNGDIHALALTTRAPES